MLSVLTKPNPGPRLCLSQSAYNTADDRWMNYDNVQGWPEFNYTTLKAIFGDIVDTPWSGSPPTPVFSSFDLTYCSEADFEHQVLTKETIETVNRALHQVCRQHYKDDSPFRLARGGMCRSYRWKPDWALVKQDSCVEDGSFVNHMPGDTKLSTSWHPGTTEEVQFKWPVRQILTYAQECHSRYGFLITDEALVVFQYTHESVYPGIALTRPLRATTDYYQQHLYTNPEDSQLDSSFNDMSIEESAGQQSYVDSGSALEHESPRFQIIPWHNEGRNKLTVRLALFYLCLMAGYGHSELGSWYPGLDTWQKEKDGTYRHNTSGLLKKNLSSEEKRKLEAPQQPGAAASTQRGGERADQQGEHEPAAYQQSYHQHPPEEGGAEPAAGRWEGDNRERGVSSAAKKDTLPKIGSKENIMWATFKRDKKKYFYKNAKGKTTEVEAWDWKEMTYKGEKVFARKGAGIYYVAEWKEWPF